MKFDLHLVALVLRDAAKSSNFASSTPLLGLLWEILSYNDIARVWLASSNVQHTHTRGLPPFLVRNLALGLLLKKITGTYTYTYTRARVHNFPLPAIYSQGVRRFSLALLRTPREGRATPFIRVLRVVTLLLPALRSARARSNRRETPAEVQ